MQHHFAIVTSGFSSFEHWFSNDPKYWPEQRVNLFTSDVASRDAGTENRASRQMSGVPQICHFGPQSTAVSNPSTKFYPIQLLSLFGSTAPSWTGGSRRVLRSDPSGMKNPLVIPISGARPDRVRYEPRRSDGARFPRPANLGATRMLNLMMLQGADYRDGSVKPTSEACSRRLLCHLRDLGNSPTRPDTTMPPRGTFWPDSLKAARLSTALDCRKPRSNEKPISNTVVALIGNSTVTRRTELREPSPIA